MVKKIKRFVVFVLFSMIFQLIHGRLQNGASGEQELKLVPSAEAKCCPANETTLDRNGNCCRCVKNDTCCHTDECCSSGSDDPVGY